MTTTEMLAQALRDIIDPIGYMERNLEEGCRLDGHAAIRAINNREFYVNLARTALAKWEAEKANEQQAERLSDQEILEACSILFLSDYKTQAKYDMAVARAIESACADKWGVKLSSQEGAQL